MAAGILLAMRLTSWFAKAAPEPTFYVESTIDGVKQPCLFMKAKADEPRPLLVGLHPWSHGFNTFPEMSAWQQEAAERDWHYLQPHFRGPNKNPDACASPKARQDILDAVDYAVRHYRVDVHRIYLAGASGGGHMAMVMAAHAPERWAAVSAWCGISDLAAWHKESRSAGRSYADDIEACVGGPPGSSLQVDEQVRYRSPVHHLAKAKDLPIDLHAGIHDGHTGSVPIHHTVDAFNAVAGVIGAECVNKKEIQALAKRNTLKQPAEQDAAYGRLIHLRRYAGASRVTIFEGGHEALPKPACAWLAQHARRP